RRSRSRSARSGSRRTSACSTSRSRRTRSRPSTRSTRACVEGPTRKASIRRCSPARSPTERVVMNSGTHGIAGKVVVITGASSGLGEATASRLSALGAAVVLGARRADRIEALAGEIVKAGGKATAVATDVTDAAQVQRLVDAGVAQFGRIDVMLNNAGLMPHSPL